MLSPDQVKPLLFHPLPQVRAAAAAYFGDSYSRDPEIVKLFLDANERFDDFNRENLIKCQYLFINDENLDRLMEIAANARSKHERFVLSAILLSAPHRLSAARSGAIANLGAAYRFSEYDWNLIFRLDALPVEALWKIFVAILRRLALVDQMTKKTDPVEIDEDDPFEYDSYEDEFDKNEFDEDDSYEHEIDEAESDADEYDKYNDDEDQNVSERLFFLDETVRFIVDDLPASDRLYDSKTCILEESDPLNALFVRMGDDVEILARTIAQSLGERDAPDWDVFHHEFQKYRDHSPTSLTLLINLAGVRRFDASIPDLLRVLSFGDDDARFEAVEALATIGGAALVNTIAERIRPNFEQWDRARSAQSVFEPTIEDEEDESLLRIVFAELLGRVKLPESEAFLLEWLDHENNDIVRLLNCESLCSLFSRQAVESIAHQIIRNEDVDLERIYCDRLENGFIALLDALNFEPRLVKEFLWKIHETRRRKRDILKKKVEFLENRLLQLRSLDNKTNLQNEILTRDDPLKSMSATEKDPAVLEPPSDPTYRAGRNDPCPCGSGKKFKKCCINKTN